MTDKTRSLEARERAALALYKLDHPTYKPEDFSEVAFLSTVLHYRERAEAAIQAFEQATAAHDAEVRAEALAETEWEYGLYEEDPHRERERPHRAYNGAHLVSENRAHVENQWRKGHPSIQFVRRRKAGPWEPVHTDGSAK